LACKILWGGLTIAEWDRYFAAVPRSTLLQHYPYAQALRATHYLGARHGLIYFDGVASGLVQICEARVLQGLVHVVQLDRGPLWFCDRVSLSQIEQFFSVFDWHFPRRLGRRRRILPEIECRSEATRDVLRNCGLVVQPRVPDYETTWLDLSQDVDLLRSGLSKSWRSALSKGERSNVLIDIDERGAAASDFLLGYEQEKHAKGYPGPSQSYRLAMVVRYWHRFYCSFTAGRPHTKLAGRLRTVAAWLAITGCYGKEFAFLSRAASKNSTWVELTPSMPLA
jgi:hypothetical protein